MTILEKAELQKIRARVKRYAELGMRLPFSDMAVIIEKLTELINK